MIPSDDSIHHSNCLFSKYEMKKTVNTKHSTLIYIYARLLHNVYRDELG